MFVAFLDLVVVENSVNKTIKVYIRRKCLSVVNQKYIV